VRVLLLCLLTCCLAVAPATAKTPITVGLGDQVPAMFDSPSFQQLGVKRVRYFIHWDAIRDPYQLRLADEFIDKARSYGKEVFLHISTNDLRPRRARLPSYDQYRRDVGALIRRMRAMFGITTWGVWNEVNHVSQPTYRSPARASSFFKAMYRECAGCTIVALDVLDQAGVTAYMRRYYRALGPTYRRRARRVGIHNYSDVNRRRSTGTRGIIRQARHYNRSTLFWLTETGGVVRFGSSFPCSASRAKDRLRYLFSLAKSLRSSLQRIYVYAWTGGDCKVRFDAGLTTASGRPRPGYYEFQRQIRDFRT
jgi:hypothetical protein